MLTDNLKFLGPVVFFFSYVAPMAANTLVITPIAGRTALAVHELSVYIVKSLYMTLFIVSIICAQCYMISHVTIYDVGVAGSHTQVKPIKVLL